MLISVSCPSGRRCNSRKVVCVQAHRGFKSHRYRHEKSLDLQVKGFFVLYHRDLGAKAKPSRFPPKVIELGTYAFAIPTDTATYLCALKNSLKIAPHSSTKTPETTSGRCGNLRSRTTSQSDPTAPAFSSKAPKTIRPTRA